MAGDNFFFFLEFVPLRSEKHFKLPLQNSIMVPHGGSFQNFFSDLTSKPLLFIWESPWDSDSHEIFNNCQAGIQPPQI